MSDKVKDAAYWEGVVRADTAAYIAAKRARTALDSHPPLHELVAEVSRHLARDHGRKQAILARSPRLAQGMDAAEVASMSSRELALRELKELGIDAGENDPEALLDAHHAGREWVRNGGVGKGGEDADRRLLGSAHDTLEGTAVDQFFASLEGRHSAQDAAAGGIESILDDYINPRE